MNNTRTKARIGWEEAMEVAIRIEESLAQACERISIAGSVRRRKPEVSDIELLCVPRIETQSVDTDLFPQAVNRLDERLEELLEMGWLEKRRKSNGTTTYGEKTKLLRDCESQVPVDIFTCQTLEWTNCLFARTGGKETNIQIAGAAKRFGLAWMPFGCGFRTKQGEILVMTSETEIFRTVGLPYVAPTQRK